MGFYLRLTSLLSQEDFIIITEYLMSEKPALNGFILFFH